MAGIFISYRRDDTSGVAGRLYDHLAKHFGRRNIFIDVDSVKPGFDFVQQLSAEVLKCDVLLALIGPRWLNTTDQSGKRRLDSETDYVRLEIASALERKVPIIPLLVDGAVLPSEDKLPENLRQLARRHALELRHTRFDADTESIIRALSETLQRKNGLAWALGASGIVIACVSIASYWHILSREVEGGEKKAPSTIEVSREVEGGAKNAPSTIEPRPKAEPREQPNSVLRCQQMLDAALGAPITFGFSDARIQPGSIPTLSSVARTAVQCNDDVLIEVQAHTDDAGSPDYNEDLTRVRAQAVVRYLVEAGVRPERLRAVGYGTRRPLVVGGTYEERMKNRRVQFVVMEKPRAVPSKRK